MSEADKKAMEAIKRIVAKGNSAEVKANKDGSLKIYEISKHIAKAN